QNVIKNFLYQFVSLPYPSIGTASALYATTYFVRNVFGGAPMPSPSAAAGIGDIPTFETNQSLIGLLGILQAALAASGVTAQANAPVKAVAPGANGVAVTVNGQTLNADYVVLACDPGASAALLSNGGTANPNLVALL